MFHIHVAPVAQPSMMPMAPAPHTTAHPAAAGTSSSDSTPGPTNPCPTPALAGPGPSTSPTSANSSTPTAQAAMSEELGFSVGAVNVQVVTGHIRLFREHGIPISDAVGRSRTLCVIAVPSHLSVADFVLFVGPFASNIEHMRILRDAVKSAGGRYMVLIRFNAQDAADAFYRGVSGKPFSSFDRERAHVVYVAQVRLQGDATSEECTSFASTLLPTDPLTAPGVVCPAYIVTTTGDSGGGGEEAGLSCGGLRQPSPTATTSATLMRVGFETYANTPAVTALTGAVPPPNCDGACPSLPPSSTCPSPVSIVAGMLTELPTCPVCLDRLDTCASGVVTTLCNHSFHCECLSRWEDDTCPVCRYCLGGESGGGGSSTACEVCGVHDNLWMCLLCGHVGCGRYSHEHALAHFRASGHTYSIELATQRVWDYAGDGYVHRLIQNKTDGKLVEVPDAHEGGRGGRSRVPPDTDRIHSHDRANGGDANPGSDDIDWRTSVEKKEAVAVEYALLLTSQLEQQRYYFEAMMAQLLSLIPPDDAQRQAAAEEVMSQHGAAGMRMYAAVEPYHPDLFLPMPGPPPPPPVPPVTTPIATAGQADGGDGGEGARKYEAASPTAVARPAPSPPPLMEGRPPGHSSGAAGATASTGHAPVPTRASPHVSPLPPPHRQRGGSAGGAGAGAGAGASTTSTLGTPMHTPFIPSHRGGPLPAQHPSPLILGGSGGGGVGASDGADWMARVHRLEELVEEAERRAGTAERERRAAAKQWEEGQRKVAELGKELAFLRGVNDTLTANTVAWEKQLTEQQARERAAAAAYTAKVRELEEQVRDLMFALEAGNKMASVDAATKAELAEGHVLVTTLGGGSRRSGARTSGGSAAGRLRASGGVSTVFSPAPKGKEVEGVEEVEEDFMSAVVPSSGSRASGGKRGGGHKGKRT